MNTSYIDLNKLKWEDGFWDERYIGYEMTDLPGCERRKDGYPHLIFDFSPEDPHNICLILDSRAVGMDDLRMINNNRAASTEYTTDRPVFDHLFGRENWQKWLENKGKETRSKWGFVEKININDIVWELMHPDSNQANSDKIYRAPAPWTDGYMILSVPTEPGREAEIGIPTTGMTRGEGQWAASGKYEDWRWWGSSTERELKKRVSQLEAWSALNEAFGSRTWQEFLAKINKEVRNEIERSSRGKR